ncbi:hypothetical protein DPMN_013557 [Dreissena polymorpha]|uniref:Uncharacterized protein n=1 Tax=Dreissena polymorpha TaxID=45954 RepID=A0A9D4S3S7_DREPO|nr:hypothetical protein DPMN_013557 [Dreissena polymorpha]
MHKALFSQRLVQFIYIFLFRYDEDLAQSDPVALDPKMKLGTGPVRGGLRETKGRPSPATWK